jgi:hypothetical protein
MLCLQTGSLDASSIEKKGLSGRLGVSKLPKTFLVVLRFRVGQGSGMLQGQVVRQFLL